MESFCFAFQLIVNSPDVNFTSLLRVPGSKCSCFICEIYLYVLTTFSKSNCQSKTFSVAMKNHYMSTLAVKLVVMSFLCTFNSIAKPQVNILICYRAYTAIHPCSSCVCSCQLVLYNAYMIITC